MEGDEITGLTGAALGRVRRRMGFLFQNAALFDSITVGENVAFPMRRHTRALRRRDPRSRRGRSSRDVGLERDYDKMPADLSGGMRKRAGLARAMALDPSILLVDEPSAGLDPITSAEIDDLLLARKRQGTTLVVVTHNIPSARTLGDELMLLHEGRIAAQGTTAELERSATPWCARSCDPQSGWIGIMSWVHVGCVTCGRVRRVRETVVGDAARDPHDWI